MRAATRTWTAPTPEWKPELTILADVSANLFAVCLLLLLALLAIGAEPPEEGPALPAAPIEAETAFDVVERAPLGAGAMVEHLRARGMPDTEAIDLFADGIIISAGSGDMNIRPDTVPGALAAAVRGVDPRRPVRLYVFDPRWYGTVIAALRERRLVITELSIPAALRSPDGAGWSSAFRTLAARGLEPESFRAGLAQLLAGGIGAEVRSQSGAGGGATASIAGRSGLAERLAAWLGGFMAVVVPLFGLAVVLAIEARERRRLMIPLSVPSL
ncbi:hypothetical protein G3545_18895 [Starkeya sp. ORNL1]|uniref:hypothetical protein n=1 Tax=Starkeya sp. ORNL1 TaxID=2709380 RepID=UPI00146456E5|nr:hypothetical protein [Starkeya sp. ORNL1]QJP15539.1 hypothetical protein G3545_18895 [Starkeya sp. ORNL1]